MLPPFTWARELVIPREEEGIVHCIMGIQGHLGEYGTERTFRQERASGMAIASNQKLRLLRSTLRIISRGI